MVAEKRRGEWRDEESGEDDKEDRVSMGIIKKSLSRK